MRMHSLVALVVIASVATPAVAHAFLERASPAAGEQLSTSPNRVALLFSEPLENSFSGITTTDAAGQDVSEGPSVARGSEMDLPLKRLAPGRYLISWHAVSVYTHRTEGKYNFLILP